MTEEIPYKGYGSKEIDIVINGYTYKLKTSVRKVATLIKEAFKPNNIDISFIAALDLFRDSIPKEDWNDFETYMSLNINDFLIELYEKLNIAKFDKEPTDKKKSD